MIDYAASEGIDQLLQVLGLWLAYHYGYFKVGQIKRVMIALGP